MLNFKGVKIWDYTQKTLGHYYPPGSPEALFADTAIACIKEGESLGIRPEDVFSPSKTKELATFRGFLMVSTLDILEALGNVASVKETAAGIYGRNRGTVGHFIETADGGMDSEYEKVRESQAGKNIEARLKALLIALKE